MRTKAAWVAGIAATILISMSAGAQQPVMPQIAVLPEMPKQTTCTAKM